MSFDRIIYIFVLFIVGYVWFSLLSLLRFPHLRVFVYAIEPREAVMAFWRRVQFYTWGAFIIIMIFLFFMYVLWIIIKKFIPNFPIPLKMILLKIPPFPQLERAGMFAFIDGLVKAIGGKGKFAKRITLVGKTFGAFVARNTSMMLRAMGIGYLANRIDKPASTGKYADGEARLKKSREETLERNRRRRRDPPFESGAYRKVDDELQQCLEENLVHVTRDMSKMERDLVRQRNGISRIICKARGVQSWSRTLTGRT